MGFSYNVNVLNQKGSPALYTDTFANRPNFGYAGRLFIANDTSAIYEDTGTAWVLIANVSSGAGTLQQVTTNGNTTNNGILVSSGGLSTNNLTVTSLTPGSVPFVGTAGLITQDNPAFFWDDTNNRLGINTTTPGNSLDVHSSGTNPILALNNTAGNQSAISFLNTAVAKWRIGNTAINSFDIYNFTLAAYAMTISSASNAVEMSGTLNANEFNLQPNGYSLLASLSRNLTGAGYGVLTLRNSANGTIQPSALTVDRTYTLPDATGTIALTSNIPTVSGTANYISKFTGTSAIGNSIIYETNSNVLINSTTDDTVNKLQVTGSAKINGNLQSVQSGGFNSTTPQLNVGLVDSTASLSTVKPAARFSNNGSFYITKIVLSDNNVSDCNIWYSPGSSGATNLFQIGVGSNTPQFTLNGSGVVIVANLAGTGSRAVLADATGALSAPVSDISVKQNIEPLKYGLETILKLNAVQFEFIEGYKNYGEGLQIGAIAQEMEQIIPEAVFTTPSTGLKGIDYNQLNGIYIKAMQELNERIELLLSRIEYLENK